MASISDAPVRQSWAGDWTSVVAKSTTEDLSAWTAWNSTLPEYSQHPYSSFSVSSEHVNTEDGDRSSSSSAMKQHPSVDSLSSRLQEEAVAPRLIVKKGELTWENPSSCQKGFVEGFERSRRRRQSSLDDFNGPSQAVFAVLERVTTSGSKSDPFAVTGGEHDLFHSASIPTFYLASPGASDPSPFDNNKLSCFVPPSVPLSLDGRSRWVPPSEWAISDSGSDGHDSHSKSSNSSGSDFLHTPKSSPRAGGSEPETYLSLYPRSFSALDHSHRKNPTALFRIRITADSTVEMRHSRRDAEDQEAPNHPAHWRITVTGQHADQPLRKGFKSTHPDHDSPRLQSGGIQEKTVCSLTSPSVTEMRQWLFCIQDAIEGSQHLACSRADYRRSSSHSILATIRLLEQLELQNISERNALQRPACKGYNEEASTPVLTSRYLSPVAANGSAYGPDFSSGFSTSSFIDSYALSPDPAHTDEEGGTLPRQEAAYDFEDAYSSILQRFSEYDTASPVESFPPALLDPRRGHARSACLDVPVSPCSFEFGRNSWDENDDSPGSPLDPWLSQHVSRSISSRRSRDSEGFGDDTVMQIFAEGFRRRSSAATTASVVLSAET